MPTLSPVKPELFALGFVMVPETGPDTFVQIPVPVAGAFPANVAVPGTAQTV